MKKKLSKIEERAYQEIKKSLNELPKESLDKGSPPYNAVEKIIRKRHWNTKKLDFYVSNAIKRYKTEIGQKQFLNCSWGKRMNEAFEKHKEEVINEMSERLRIYRMNKKKKIMKLQLSEEKWKFVKSANEK